MKRPTDVGRFMAKAEQALTTARSLLTQSDTAVICNRAYYAMFNAGHALLLADGAETAEQPIRTHHGLILKLKDLAVRHVVDDATVRLILEVQYLRQLADYSAEETRPQDARLAVEKADRFVATIREKLG